MISLILERKENLRRRHSCFTFHNLSFMFLYDNVCVKHYTLESFFIFSPFQINLLNLL